ncbi:hypothetical protein C3K47_11345 [Solitalea longa]|uniref:T6SS Phospholipase effector Tle1-like catalytic domain-containing protein n=1 Tax=Solitalea longa TaxID=2079460 RepID=A0A2S5A197_9SPHI|nr:DUF2235 domain-containing protein [Solitalea longa]POY36335.1 hypothetical protein C3K47_11345 [Solitalea longa]
MKRIIICCDGTWNKPGDYPTNVQRIFEGILPEATICVDGKETRIPQLAYYVKGVGTSGWFDRWIGGITGKGIDENIMDAYKFLIGNYSPGDELYLFGFSRGAYTVRSLAGMVRNCGILKPQKFNLFSDAYLLYRARSNNQFNINKIKSEELKALILKYSQKLKAENKKEILFHPDSGFMALFKRRNSICFDKLTKEFNIPIKFIGVWDTVGALGIPTQFALFSKNKKYRFHDVQLSSYIENAYHALAVDERRTNFKPTLWETSKKNIKNGEKKQTLEQVWFPGVHSDIGGGYKTKGLSFIALLWMIDKAKKTGLEFSPVYLRWINKVANCADHFELHNEEKAYLKLLNSIKSRRIDDLAWRKTSKNEIIHSFIFHYPRLNLKYKPRNINNSILNKLPHTP